MKRLLDVIVSLLILTLFSVIIAGTAIVVRWKLGAPIIYTQERIGYQGKPFRIFKFRTMTNELDYEGELLPDEMRMTKVGKWIRKMSLDEFPQLINVLKGEMSLIGPRPLLSRYLPYYTEQEAKRHHVRPGITGYAQVHGRNYVNWKRRFELDVHYVENQSFWLDLAIIFKTIKLVLKREDIEDVPGQSMLDFDVERKLELQKNEPAEGGQVHDYSYL
ncbi:sugar transferase [Halobacillus yeomjeoni]|uniref:Sugar transferase n=1 Tax=Halobacillus yeomjeoni TaxID=311194 RepID=A0A931HWL6_9BACI|nr:sugar transferase [Halobacillus yeomjeoni]MBH0230808.1 sugar transferase [Halobacillus yeomjeoni]